MARPARIRDRVQGNKYEYARQLRRKSTPAEKALWRHLKGRQLAGRKFRRQSIIFGWIVDFYCPSELLIVEVDGEIHENQVEADERRDRVMTEAGFTVLRFTNHQVFTSPNKVLAHIEYQFTKG